MINKLQNYNKQILAVVSMLLLVVFLMPTAVTRCSSGGADAGTVYATAADGSTLTLGELDRMRAELAVLELMGDPMSQALGLDKNPEHWWMLVKEAGDAGLIGGPADGRALLEMAAPMRGTTADELLGRLCGSARQQPQVVLQALANLRGVERLVNLVLGARNLSEVRARLAARELLADVTCDVAPIDAFTVGDAVPVDPPSAEQLMQTFTKGKAFLAGAGPGGIGYLVPDRVRIEWILIPSGDIARSVANDPALGPVELRKEFRRDPRAFGVTEAELAPGATAPSFDAYAAKVRDAVERRLLKERVERIATFVRDWGRAALRDAPAEGGRVKLPEDWATAMPPLAELSGRLAATFGIARPDPSSSTGDGMTFAEIDGNAFLGRATSAEFGRPMRVSALVRAMREFDPESRLAVQPGVIGPVATTPTDDVLVWRVTMAEKAHEPASLDEVRDAVVRDATAEARYAKLSAMADELAAKAGGQGLDTVAKEYGTTVQAASGVHLAAVQTMNQFGLRFAGSLPKAGQDVDAIRAVVRFALALPTDKPIDALPVADRTMAVAVPSKLAVLVVRINGIVPLFEEDYRVLVERGAIARAMMEDEPAPDVAASFGLEAMRKRTGRVLSNPDGPDRPTAPDQPMF